MSSRGESPADAGRLLGHCANPSELHSGTAMQTQCWPCWFHLWSKIGITAQKGNRKRLSYKRRKSAFPCLSLAARQRERIWFPSRNISGEEDRWKKLLKPNKLLQKSVCVIQPGRHHHSLLDVDSYLLGPQWNHSGRVKTTEYFYELKCLQSTRTWWSFFLLLLLLFNYGQNSEFPHMKSIAFKR